MNKKFFSALLMGSLLLGGTFVSCSDYDDDIKNLQEQINNLATKSDVEARLSQLQSALTAAQSTATEALAAAKAADNTAEVKALQTKLADIETALAAVKSAQEAVSKEVADQLAAFDEATKKAIADAQKKTEETVGKVAGAVTDVTFVQSFTAEKLGAFDQVYVTIVEKDNVFGKDLTNEMAFVKNTQVQRNAQSLVVTVSPANVELTPDMISLVASDGSNLDELIDIVSVKRSNKLITRATNAANWEVTTRLKAYDKKAFEAAALKDKKQILYAVQVNNTLSTAADRFVTTSFDVALATGKYEPVDTLEYFVGDKSINEINNRYAKGSKSFSGTPKGNVAPEYTWTAAAATKMVTEGTGTNVTLDEGDNRSKKAAYPLVQGKELTITLDQTGAASVEDASAVDIKALYITLDTENAIESAPSEINAWNSYSYTGLNTVVEGNSATISVNAKTAISDFIGFRVYAVNWDGTLVDPDGKAFYVYVGDEANVHALVPVVKTPVDAHDSIGVSDKVTLAQVVDASRVTLSIDDNDEKVGFTVTLAGKSVAAEAGEETANFGGGMASIFATKDALKDVQITMAPNKALTVVKDGKTYTGTITVYDSNDIVLYTVPISYTKQLPDSTPEGFSVKTNQVVNGVYNCYLVPNAPTAATTGSMPMSQVFNYGKGVPSMYEITFAESDKNSKNELIDVKVKGNATLAVGKDYIDNKTAHATSISYNYGLISSETKNAQGVIVDYVVSTGVSFNTVYNCIYNDQFKWSWATREQLGGDYNTLKDATKPANGYVKDPWSHKLTYGDKEVTVNAAEFIFGTTPIDSNYAGLLSVLSAAPGKHNNQLDGSKATVKLITKANKQENEYFIPTVKADGITFTVDPTSSNPTADVETTLELTYKDTYGHDVVIAVDVTIVKR